MQLGQPAWRTKAYKAARTPVKRRVRTGWARRPMRGRYWGRGPILGKPIRRPHPILKATTRRPKAGVVRAVASRMRDRRPIHPRMFKKLRRFRKGTPVFKRRAPGISYGGPAGFFSWLGRRFPQAYRSLKLRRAPVFRVPSLAAGVRMGAIPDLYAPPGMQGLGATVSAETSTAPAPSGWGTKILDFIKVAVPSILQYKVISANVKRAEQGLPPMDIETVQPSARIEIGMPPRVEAAVATGARMMPLVIAGVGALVILPMVMRGRGKGRGRR